MRSEEELPGSPAPGSWFLVPITPFGLEVRPLAGGDRRLPGSADLKAWLAAHRVVLLRGFPPPDDAGFLAFGQTLGEILEWQFGAVNELRVQDAPKNYLYTDHAVPFHWDGAFVGRIPHAILFHCVAAPPPGGGGETLFCDTLRLLEHTAPRRRAAWEGVSITYTTDKLAHYGGSFTSPLVVPHPVTGTPTLRFAEPVADLNPVFLEITGIPAGEQPAFLAEMAALLRHPTWSYAHSWETNDLLIADNWTLLHGRNAFHRPGGRHLRRINLLG